MTDKIIADAELAYQRALADGKFRVRTCATGMKRYTAADFPNTQAIAAPGVSAGHPGTTVETQGGQPHIHIHIGSAGK